ncbi:MAG: hypothetical protein C4547_06285 [Phycisphaerales bacterium]|nr:MAG: hypothetical protein C4547_06285 [Phycisphaerales bacterium]
MSKRRGPPGRGNNWHHDGGPPGNLDKLRIQSINAAAAGQHARAIELARRYHMRRPNDVGVLDHLASTHQKIDDWEGVLKWGRKSYELDPRWDHLHILIQAYNKLDRLKPLVAFCEEEIRRHDAGESVRYPEVRKLLSTSRFWARFRLGIRSILRYFHDRAEHRRRREEAARRAEEKRLAARRAAEAEQAALHRPRPTVMEPPEWPTAAVPPAPLRVDVDTAAVEEELSTLSRDTLAARAPCVVLPPVYVKQDGIEALFHAEFQAINTKLEFKGVHESVGEYLGVGLFYEIQAAGREDGVLEPWINVDTGAVLTFPPHGLDDASPAGPAEAGAFKPLTGPQLASLVRRAALKARTRVEEQTRPHLRTALSDWERAFTAAQAEHRRNWEAFAQASTNKRKEAPTGSEGPTGAEGAVQRRLAELRASLAQRVQAFDQTVGQIALEHTTAVSVSVLDFRRLRLPIMLCTVQLTRRKASRTLLIPYNPLTRQLEPLPCTHCDRDTFALGATEAGDLLCAQCVKV